MVSLCLILSKNPLDIKVIKSSKGQGDDTNDITLIKHLQLIQSSSVFGMGSMYLILFSTREDLGQKVTRKLSKYFGKK